MKIVDLTPDTVHDSINLCIGSKPGFEQAREEKRRWLEARLPLRVGAKLAYYDDSLAGMLEYSPIEDTPFPIIGKHLLHIHCIWILPSFQKRGIGKELVKSLVHEAERRGRKGISVIAQPGVFFMPTSFFLNQKFRTVDRRNQSELMWREIEPAIPPKFITSTFSPTTRPDKISIDVLYCSQCPWTIKSRERMTRISKEFGNDIKIHTVRTDDRSVMEDTGDLKGVYVNGQDFYFASTEEDIRKMLTAKTKRLHSPVRLARLARSQAQLEQRIAVKIET
jgi:GNAT superfamily N-acetyltransferase/predicted Rdx family selenoprotein